MKKIIVFFATFVVALIGCTTAYCMEYGNTFPSYVQYSGGVYIEVNSSAGLGPLVLPITYKNNTFSFRNRSGFNVLNVTNGTLSGYFIFCNGTQYTLRIQAFNTAEIRANDNYSTPWQSLTINSILNTNVNFMDNTDSDRHSDPVFTKYDFSFKEQFYISFAVVALFLILATNFLYYMRNRGY